MLFADAPLIFADTPIALRRRHYLCFSFRLPPIAFHFPSPPPPPPLYVCDIDVRRFRFRHIDRRFRPLTAFADAADSPFSII
jgi:hypothetical protein